jgi:hypothetical protein
MSPTSYSARGGLHPASYLAMQIDGIVANASSTAQYIRHQVNVKLI